MRKTQVEVVAVFASAHCDKLLRRSWMNGDGPVKVCFCSPHLDCDSKALQHLIGTHALHVQAHHLQGAHRQRGEYSAAGVTRKQKLQAAIRSPPS